MTEEIKKHIKEKLALVPTLPGSYQMKNKDGIIIYVGKAKNLKNRLKSYFTGTVTGKTQMLVNDIVDFEYIVTNSELESLILEITLIKKYDPRYNILLKDDKSYPYIEFTNEEYPTLKVIRNVNRKKRKNRLFGPFPNVNAARKTVEIINRLYPLRKCTTLKKEVCLYYHIGECLGYCDKTKEIPKEKLNQMKNEIIAFLKGDDKIVTEKIKTMMYQASEDMNYERALELKQMLQDIEVTLKKQKIDLNHNYNMDVFAYYKDKNYLSIHVFFVRDGILFGRHKEILTSMEEVEEELLEYIIKFYEKNSYLPKEILVPECVDGKLLEEYLQVPVLTPQRGDLRKLLLMCEENARIHLEEQEEVLKKDKKEKEKALKELEELLHVSPIHRMEAFDNSHLFGTYYVGGMVVFDDFEPQKDSYRKYKISVDVKDDLNAMREVLYRRYFKVLMKEENPPDLIIIDGGALQVSVCKEILDSLHLKIPMIGLKKDDHHRTYSLINSDLEELSLDPKSHLFLFLTRIQDEVHRFAISYHRNIKSKGMLSSMLDVVDGIGEVRKKELLKRFGSLRKMKEATQEELQEVLTKDVAQNLYTFLQEYEKE